MTAFLNYNGTPVELDPKMCDSGVTETCELYYNDGGTAVLIQSPVDVIEGFEGADDYSEMFQNTFSGSATMTSNAALATSEGSTQGMRCEGFVEMYTLPGVRSPAVEYNREASFYFHPRLHDSGDQWHFILAPQPDRSFPPDYCYRFEFHMGGGSRITLMDSNGRTVLATEESSTWSRQLYECRFTADGNGLTMTCNGQTLSTSNTRFIDSQMGFGFRASGGGRVDYDWLKHV